MAIVINGSGTITGISAGGLPDGSVTAADIESSLDLSGKTVTLPAGTGGKVLQVVQDSGNGFAATTSTTLQSIGLSASITPSSTSSKILVQVNGVCRASNARLQLQVLRDSTSIYRVSEATGDFHNIQQQYFVNVLDSPNTTSSITYSVNAASNNGNTLGTNDVGTLTNGAIHYITLMEIAG